MEFTTRISEQDHLAAARLMMRSAWLRGMAVLCYVLASLLIVEIVRTYVWMKMNPGNSAATQNFVATFANLSPFLVVIGMWWALSGWYIPHDLRRKYRRDVTYAGDLKERLDENGIVETSSAGSSSSRPWAVCSHWRESKSVFILVLQSQIYYTFPKACLDAAQQEELRSILAVHLRNK
jgi:hypothetical protein